MQGIYNCIHETSYVSAVYSVAAVLYLLFVLNVILFHMCNMIFTFKLLFSEVCMQCPIWVFSVGFDFALSLYVARVLSE
jgi:hypothetical protein